MRKTWWTRLLVTVGLALLSASTVLGVTENSTVVAQISANQKLSVDTTTIDFGSIGATDFDTGYKELIEAQTITVWSNVDWVLNVVANAAAFSYSGDYTDPGKPASDLYIRTSSSHSKVTDTIAYAPLNTTGFWIAKGGRGGNISLTVDFKLLLDYAQDLPGNYTLTITYTLSTE